MRRFISNSYALFLGLIGLIGLIGLVSCANELDKMKAPEIPVSLELRSFAGDTFAGDSLVLQPSGSVYGVIRIDIDKPLIEVEEAMLGKVALVSASDPDIKEETSDGTTTRRGLQEFTFSDSQVATAVWQHIYNLAAEKGWLVKSVEYTRYTSKMVSDGVAQITLHFPITVSGLDGEAVKNGELQLSYHQYVKGAEIPDLTDQSEVFSVFPSVDNNGLTSTANILGKGTIYHTTVDAKTGEKSVTEWPFSGTATASVSLSKDTCWVEKFGVELVSAPSPNTKDLSNGNTIGQETTMATWKFSDGQTGKGLLRWIYEKVAEASGTPHVVVENLRYNEAGTKVQKINENAAWVTMSFLVDYHSEDSKTSSSDRLEMLVTYVQAIPVPEEPETPADNLQITFTSSGKGELTAKATYLSGEKETTSKYIWVAAQVGHYQPGTALMVATTTIAEEKQTTSPREEKSSQKRDDVRLTTVGEESTNYAFFRSNGGGMLEHPFELVLFEATSLTLTVPGGTVEIKLVPQTVFNKNRFEKEETLVGNKIGNNPVYTYEKTIVLSANHYVSCSVAYTGEKEVIFNGKQLQSGVEVPVQIDCLTDGLLWENISKTPLYTIQ